MKAHLAGCAGLCCSQRPVTLSHTEATYRVYTSEVARKSREEHIELTRVVGLV